MSAPFEDVENIKMSKEDKYRGRCNVPKNSVQSRITAAS